MVALVYSPSSIIFIILLELLFLNTSCTVDIILRKNDHINASVSVMYKIYNTYFSVTKIDE